MSKTAIVYTCSHVTSEVSNERFDWLGDLIEDVAPDYVIDLGDGADMVSLNTYDTRNPKAICSKSYEKDIEAYNEAQDRLWSRYKKKKKKRPYRIGFEGNHENRIKKAISVDPRLEGTKYGISFNHLNTDLWFDEYNEYEHSAPALVAYDGVLYSHYLGSGAYGTAMSGIHHAYGLIQKCNNSVTVGHSHKRSMYFKDDAHPNPIIGLVAGCYKGKEEGWAGQANREWWKGVVIKRQIDNGLYEPEFVSQETLRKTYGK